MYPCTAFWQVSRSDGRLDLTWGMAHADQDPVDDNLLEATVVVDGLLDAGVISSAISSARTFELR